jgi:hypothetical protein
MIDLGTEIGVLKQQNAELLAALERFAHVPCERHGNIHCTMLPADSGVRFCAPCGARAAIAKAKGE